MITSVRLKNFKNFADETLRMGPFTVLVGANASGKSNVRDAFRFLHGIGRGYRLADIIGGRYGAGGQVEWEQLRGGVDEIVRIGEDRFAMTVGIGFPGYTLEEYGIVVGGGTGQAATFHVMDENLRVRPSKNTSKGWSQKRPWDVFTSRTDKSDAIWRDRDNPQLALRMAKTPKQKKLGYRVNVARDRSALVQVQGHKPLLKDHKDRARGVQDILASMRFLDLSPERMRQPAFPGQTVLGDGGDNLPTVLREICADPKRRDTLIEWTRELTPMDVEDFEFPVDPTTGRVQLALREAGGRTISAYAASDGTLRFLAMLAALLGEDPAGLYVFEEIDNGIHPSRLRLLIDLIESQTKKGHVQVLTTTHSPDLLSMVSDETFKHTSVVCRHPDTNAGVIRPVAELPDADRLRHSRGLGRLHASGWMEDAVFFTEEDGAVGP